jgi:hypothetical protein
MPKGTVVVRLTWIMAHVGHNVNELVSRNSNTQKIYNKKGHQGRMAKRWATAASSCRQTKAFFPNITSKRNAQIQTLLGQADRKISPTKKCLIFQPNLESYSRANIFTTGMLVSGPGWIECSGGIGIIIVL